MIISRLTLAKREKHCESRTMDVQHTDWLVYTPFGHFVCSSSLPNDDDQLNIWVKVNNNRSKYGLRHRALAHTEQQAIKATKNDLCIYFQTGKPTV